MQRVHVIYQGGESRYNPGNAVDFMLAVVDGVELYAEADPDDYGYGEPGYEETATYDDLKAAILGQAAEHGIPAIKLDFDD